MHLKRTLLFVVCILFLNILAQAQCNTLRPQIDISFNTDQDCAPVSVTQFQITYYFNAPQDPATIAILYEWNDPTSATTLVDQGSGLIASAGNTAFTANATFTYTQNAQCTIVPTTSVFINGVICPTSRQTQTAFFWDNDNEGNGNVTIDPQSWDVCFDNPIINAQFT